MTQSNSTFSEFMNQGSEGGTDVSLGRPKKLKPQEKAALSLARLSRPQLFKRFLNCGYSAATASAMADVFTCCLIAQETGQKANPLEGIH